jgi:hypothetical protein
VDGIQVGQNPNLGLYPARLGDTPNNWIGRSQNPADPFLAGEVDDLRIYQRGLPRMEIAEIVVTDRIHGLAAFIAGQAIDHGLQRALTVKLEQALELFTRGKAADALDVLTGDFLAQVEAERGHKLTGEQATAIAEATEPIVATIRATLD